MSAYMIASVNVKDPDLYAQYEKATSETLAPFKVRPILHNGEMVTYEGELPAAHFVVMKFESLGEIDRFYKSDAYQKVIGLRNAASETHFLIAMQSVDG